MDKARRTIIKISISPRKKIKLMFVDKPDLNKNCLMLWVDGKLRFKSIAFEIGMGRGDQGRGDRGIECANKVSEMDFFFVSMVLQPR